MSARRTRDVRRRNDGRVDPDSHADVLPMLEPGPYDPISDEDR